MAPLDGLTVRIELLAPSGQQTVVYQSVLDQGTHRVKLNSAEQGVHTACVYLDDVLYERLELDFE